MTKVIEAEKKKKPVKQKKKKRWGFWLGIVLAVGLFSSLSFKINGALEAFEDLELRQSSLISELGAISGDSAEVRKYLGMEVKNHSEELVTEGEDVVDDSEENEVNTDSLQVAMFKYIGFLEESTRIEDERAKNVGLLEELVGFELFEEFMDSNDFSRENLEMGMRFSDEGGSFSLMIEENSGEMKIVDVSGERSIEAEGVADLWTVLTDYIREDWPSVVAMEKEKARIEEELYLALESENVELLLEEKGLYFDEELVLFNKSDERVGALEIGAKLKVSAEGKNEVIEGEIEGGLLSFIGKVDHLTLIEKKVAEAMKSIEGTLNDAGFQAELARIGLSIGEVREDDERYYYDVLQGESVVKSIVLEKATGVVNITEPDGSNGENLLFFDPEFKKKTLEIPEDIPEYEQLGDEEEDGQFNILLAGKHGSLVDTMIFAHLNERTREIKMISIPRDLYYRGRKINAYPALYGMPELKRALSDITGYELDHYVLVDMYAFIEVVDLVGGIDITLEKSVVDPYYRVVDNGVEGTLNYQPGDYHLGGKEALRLARSRKTSSDFARAERQQLILQALLNKARNFGFGDADTVYEIAKTVLAKTDTDVGIDEALSYYFKYQGYEITSMDVMSSGNVLYVPPYTSKADCDAQVALAEANGGPRPSCEGGNHAYTLMPRNDDWNVVKWFFRENFQ